MTDNITKESFLGEVQRLYTKIAQGKKEDFAKTMLNRSGESGHPCLVPEFSGRTFNFSPLNITLAVGLS